MPATETAPTTTPKRRVPRQERSRRRVEDLLDAAATLVVEHGVEALTTRDIARAAGAPVASLYQYFADKEDVLLALAQRDMDEMDTQVATDLAALAEAEELTVAAVVRTTMLAFVAVYRRRRAFVEIYLRGRTNPALHRFGRLHNREIAESLRAYAVDAGIATPDMTVAAAELAVEVGDRIFQLAYEDDPVGDDTIIEEGIALMSANLERYATPAGLSGVRA